MIHSHLPLWMFAIFYLAAVLSDVHSTSSSPSPSRPISTESHPSSLLAKSIVGGSTELKPPPEETSSLFGVSRKNVVPENESIYVVKRDGSKEPLEGKKVCVFRKSCCWSQTSLQPSLFILSFANTVSNCRF